MDALNVGDAEERKAAVADLTGESRIASVRLDIGRLLREGLLIDVDLHNFTCLRTGVTWQELGINPTDKRRDRIQKGQKVLVPLKYARKLKSLETRFRQSIVRYSFDVEAMSPWSWIPTTAWDAWKEAWNSLCGDLELLKTQIKNDLEGIREGNEDYFRSVAKKAWKAYNTPDEDAVIITSTGRVYAGYYDFEREIVESALAKVPTADDIDQIHADYKTGFLLLPPDIIEHYGAAEAKADAEWAEARAAKAKADIAETEAKHAKWDLQNEKLTQAARLDAIRQAEHERTKAALADEIASPLTEIMVQFRDRIYTDITDIAATLKKNGTFVGKVGKKARGLRDMYDLLASATNDTELMDALDNLRVAMDKPGAGGAKYDTDALKNAIADIVDVTKDAAIQMRGHDAYNTTADFLEV